MPDSLLLEGCSTAPGLLISRYPSSSGLSHKETVGSPKFPSYPFEYMPWSKTPVVSQSLAIAQPGLLPSAACRASAFSCNAGLSNDHNYTFFGAQYRACTLDPSSSVLPLPGLHVDFTTDLVANLCSEPVLSVAEGWDFPV